MTNAQAASDSAGDPARPIDERLAEVYEQTARALEHSAALAEKHARRHGQAGHTSSAEREELTARWARENAARARDAADRATARVHARRRTS